MSTPVTQLIEATESLHLSDGLCENWEQKGSASDSVHRYFAALPDIHTYHQAIGVPSHLPPKNGLLMQGHGYASTIPGGTAEKKAQVNAEFIYIFRKVDPAKPFDQVPHQWTAVLRVENSRRPFEDETWAIITSFPAFKMTPNGYKDTRNHTERPRDIDTTDEPLKDAKKYLATGYSLIQHYTDADWRSGNPLRGDGESPGVRSSTGHIPVYTRPSRVCLGWGNYDEFLSRQAAGRTVRKDMVKEEEWNVDRDTTVKFVNKDGQVVSTVPNNIPKEHFPQCQEFPVSLYYELTQGQRRGFQRGPETSAMSNQAS